jgi:membrane associated rhomboid family serine protease
MFFPIGDDQVKGGSKPIFSYAFIAINIIVFVFFQLPSDAFTYAYSCIPYEITTGVDYLETLRFNIRGNEIIVQHQVGPKPLYLTLLYSAFMHTGWWHLIGNMMFLWVFADNIESPIGNIRFVVFYLLGGVAASYAHIASDPMSTTICLGASGAIAACLGAYLVMFPKSKIKMLFFIKIFKVPAYVFLGIWIVQQLVSVFGFLGEGSNTAWWAHIGGFAFGVVAGFFFKYMYPKIQQNFPEYSPIKREGSRYNNRYITNRLN